MAEPKISVLIPMYNRKHYISDAVDSVLRQTFQDFEIIIRDDCSKDGSYEFVHEKYASEISIGKIKLVRNPENLGEFGNVRQLFFEATGKYIYLLHSDDVILSHALQYLHDVAESCSADIVHCTAHLGTPPDGIINADTKFILAYHDRTRTDKVALMPNDPIFRLKEWSEGGTFCDAPYNLYNRKFVADNHLLFDHPAFGLNLFHLAWLMTAKIFVKTPVPCYVYRDSFDSTTRNYNTVDTVSNYICGMMDNVRWLDKFLLRLPFIKDNPEIQRFVKFKFLVLFDEYMILRRGFYKDGISDELYEAVEGAFRKYLGTDAFYPTVLFNWIHASQCGRNLSQIMLQRAIDSLSAPPVSEINHI